MKIGETNPLPDLPNKRIKGKEQGGSAKGATVRGQEEPVFGQAFMDASRQQATRALDLVLADLDAAGERLAAAQNFEEMEKYKALVKEFLQKVTQGLGKLHFSDGGQGKQGKIHVILQKLDLELDRLAQEVVKRQAGPLRILEKLDQIRGLLLDLYK